MATLLNSKKSKLAIHTSIYFSHRLQKELKQIIAQISDAFIKASKLIDLNDIDLYLTQDDKWLIMPEFGFGGITYSSKSMAVSVDSNNYSKDEVNNELAAMVAHELNHAARLKSLPINNWNNVTFAQDIIQEGIAQVFQETLYSNSKQYINKAVLKNINFWFNKTKRLHNKDRAEYDRNAWFFGDKLTPRWVGYTLGYVIVKDYLDINTISLRKLTKLNSDNIIKSFTLPK